MGEVVDMNAQARLIREAREARARRKSEREMDEITRQIEAALRAPLPDMEA